jgi:hypothetical protein
LWSTETSRTTKATKEQIWKLWTDVTNWKKWDNDVEDSKLYGDFKDGTQGILKPSGGPKTKFITTDVIHPEKFTLRSNLPLCTMDFIHTMSETKDGLTITHKVILKGLLSFFFSKIIGKKIAKGLPYAVENLISLAEVNKK